jgi:hypothetical protein
MVGPTKIYVLLLCEYYLILKNKKKMGVSGGSAYIIKSKDLEM